MFTTEDYKNRIERGETYPPDVVYFLGIANKRNKQTIKNAFIINSNQTMI